MLSEMPNPHATKELLDRGASISFGPIDSDFTYLSGATLCKENLDYTIYLNDESGQPQTVYSRRRAHFEVVWSLFENLRRWREVTITQPEREHHV